MQINVLHMAHLSIRYGAEKQLLDYLTLTKKASNEIRHFVCALRISEPIYEELKNLGIPVIITRLWPWNLSEFSRFVKQHNIHILHVHNQLRFPLRSRILPKLAGIPRIVEHEHGMIWNTSSTQMIKWTNKLVTANLCNSNAAKILLSRKCDINAEVIYNGIPMPSDQQALGISLKNQLRLPEGAKLVGFVGRLNNPKGAEAFVRIIPHIIPEVPQARFIIVGDGPMRESLEAAVNDLGIKNYVYFLGYQEKVFNLIKQMDAIVVPSFREAFGNVVIEASLARKPVIASNVDGIAETLIDGETGFLIDCTEPVTARVKGLNRLPEAVVDGRSKELRPPKLPNIEMMAKKVVICLQNPDLANDLGNKAYSRAVSLFSLERYRTDLDNLYRRHCEK